MRKTEFGKRKAGAMSTIHVLVVDDHEPFRRFICSTLGKKTGLQLIGEASDGLDAVQKAAELLPDLILLDIGLPSLNGIEAARRIHKLVPQAKILFLSQESSADIVQEALGLGALGYVVKGDAGSELLAAIRAVLEGRQFVSSGVLGQNLTSRVEFANS
jgi:DNA-binding NarL/FixJ family response regulator